MDTFQNDELIARLLDLMEENGQQGQAADIRRLCGYVDEMEKQYAAVLMELQDIKQRLSEAAAEKHPVKEQLSTALQATEAKLEQVRDQLTELKEKIITWAENTVDNFKRMGVAALDNAVASLGIRQLLEGIRDRMESCAQNIQSAITQAETVGKELRTAGSHLANAGRAAVGMEIRQKDVTQEGRFQSAVLAPMRGMRKMLSGMGKSADAALSCVDKLERTAERSRGKRERTSVRRRLEQKKESLAPPTPSSPDRVKKKSEAAL